jgi:hypothetical protein
MAPGAVVRNPLRDRQRVASVAAFSAPARADAPGPWGWLSWLAPAGCNSILLRMQRRSYSP